MDLFTEDDLRELVGIRDSRCVSIYMTTFGVGAELQQNPVRFKNKIAESEEKLVELGFRRSDTVDMLVPLRQLLQNAAFWQHMSNGLAIFIAPGIMKTYRVPIQLPDLTIVGTRFHIKPALPLLAGNTRYHVLNLDLSGVRIYSGARYTFGPVEYDKLPPGLDETLGFDTQEKQVQFSSQPSITGGNQITVFGYGRQTDKHKVNIVNYFHRVNDAVKVFLHNSNAPLILSGPDYLHPLYREANTYPHLMDEAITINTNRLSDSEIQEKSWNIVSPLFEEKQNKALSYFRHLAVDNSAAVSNDLKTIIEGARHGRIDTVFIADGIWHQWGKYDAINQSMELHESEMPGDEDLLDRAAVDTLLRGGVVYIIDPVVTPDAAPAAAILRY